MDAFGIFEGGGAKGFAHVGALKAAEEESVNFVGVAGTSAGSIVAALVAAGFSADELYSPEDPRSLFRVNFVNFFDPTDWQNLKVLRRDAVTTFRRCRTPWQFWWATTWFVRRNRNRLRRLGISGGLLDTSEFERWLNGQLRRKLQEKNPGFEPSGENGTVALRDIPMPLKIVSADVIRQRIKVFTLPEYADVSVAAAVGASIAIPFIFDPKVWDSGRLVDGGVMSNFPVWVFDRERNDWPPLTPTFGFRLVSKQKNNGDVDGDVAQVEFSLLDHAVGVFQTAVFGDNSLETREVESLHEIPLRVRIGPLDFDISDQAKHDVYNEGKNDARDFFRDEYVGPRDPSYMRIILKLVHQAMIAALGHNGHLRVNVMLPVILFRLSTLTIWMATTIAMIACIFRKDRARADCAGTSLIT